MEKVAIDVAGRPLSFETGRFARQATGSVLVSYGETIALVTCTVDPQPNPAADFLPLRVDFEEKMYAVGRIPGGFFRREGRPSDEAILTCRKIDRPIRPLLPSGLRNETQIIANALSAENANSIDVVAMIGGSAAVALSGLPFDGPFGVAQIGHINGELVLNPSFEQLERESDLDVLVAATRNGIVMLEMSGHSVSESTVMEAIEMGVAACLPICSAIEELTAKAGKPKLDLPLWAPNAEIEQYVYEHAKEAIAEAMLIARKQERDDRLNQIAAELEAALLESYPDCRNDVREAMNKIAKQITRKMILEDGIRVDGRAMNELRPISIEVGGFPRAHGAGCFTRGETQCLTMATLGPKRDQRLVRTLQEEEYSRFMHQYNFPPFCTGEVKPLRAPGRREIGHGHLAQKALESVLPPEEEFPYTIRLVSEILESNGSSSMAAVCGSTLALMDAGVPITAPVAGVSVGVVYENEQKYALLVDLQGAEDQLGSDMDFKVAGTREGVNAIHLDMKIQGLPSHILSEALALAREARLQILDLMTEVIPYPRAELSRYAPRIFSMEIDKDKIGLLIGPGGKMIRKIEDDYGVEIDIQDDGVVFIAATDSDSATGAREFIHSLTRDIQVGEEFTAKITKTTPFGAFAELMPGKEGLIHISELAWEHVRATEDIVKVGDQVRVRVIEVDDDGKIRLSRKVLLERRSPTRSTQGGGHPRADRPLSREQQTASPHRSNAFDRRSDSRRGFSRPRGERTSDEKLDRPGLGSNAYLREPRKR